LEKETGRKYIKLVESYRKSRYLEKFDSPALFVPLMVKILRKKIQGSQLTIFRKRLLITEELGILIQHLHIVYRHGFATYMAENNANPAAIQVLFRT
jgi:hypothetical protein